MILSSSVLKVCDPASDWSLVIYFHIVLVVACMVACRTAFLYFLSASVGDCASDWLLVIEFCMVLLVACRIVLLLNVSAYAGDCTSDWSLVIDFITKVIVACVVACTVRVLLEKLSWESLIQLHQVTEQARLLYFKCRSG